MAKAHRGTALKELPARGRGTCPVCKATKAKLLYTLNKGDEQLKVCKKCRNKIV